ncbi:MAG: ATP-binding protein [Methylococcales symbiont of Iophon sp. n. MRB-2018]|nr:MAG: ATP-binding protein [Methylococcales symbiont of Iophon sp. n. MRB-2018]KAF3980284.1 MAG: ATP-binding protein [Methylococcales symbiont of Iophon sp. n. MRB-2018]
MRLTIKNIGVIKKADINLSGLTVIAGENDSGKSTVGKLMFAIIKAISKYKSELEESKENNIKQAVEKIYFSIRRELFSSNEDSKELFHPHYFIAEIDSLGIKAIDSRIDYLKENGVYNDKEKKLFADLEGIINQNYDKNSVIKRAFEKVTYSEFKGEITSKKTQQSSVTISEEDYTILTVEYDKNTLSEFNLRDEFYFNDSVIIETPMILNLSESIRNSKSLFTPQDKQTRLHSLDRANVAFHTKDLETKLRDSAYEENLFFNPEDNDLYGKITGIINGKIKFVKERNEFVYFKNKESHSITNVASGIKSFGILQMLLSVDFLDERTLIVLDEPEVHLHPNWQLKYAEIITLLVKKDFNVLVTTHSPYMIEALEKYSEQYEVGANFYLAEDGVIKSENNNNTLIKTFKKLSEPFAVFRDLKAKKL